jgi:copper resistance protein B
MGDLSGAFEVEFDSLLTQRVIMQPRFAMNLQAQDVPDRDLGAGMTSIEAALRVRYEIVREFAPDAGISWAQRVGETAARLPPGDDSGAVSVVAGIRVWF